MKTNPITRFFHSIAGKVTGIFVLCILLLVLTNWFLNSFAFTEYYEEEQRELLITAYEEIDDAPRSPRTLTGLLDGYSMQHGVQAMMWSDTHVIYAPPRTSPAFGFNARPAPIRLKNGEFQISNTPPPMAQGDSSWLTLTARTTDGYNLSLWVSLSDAQSTTEINNRFLLWSALVALLVGGLAIVVLSRSLTRPMRKLSSMVRHMAELDFSERYVGDGSDELTELGQHLNTVSETLESTVSELKTANLRLKGDMVLQEQQNEARTRFIQNVSHELKTPLALIQTYAEGLSENAVDDPESRAYYCNVIEDEAQRLTQMLSKLTTLMQLESGNEELTIDRFDVRALFERLLERFEPLFYERNATAVPLPETPCFAWGDAELIENVAINYLTNALNHVTPGGEIRITWETTPQGTVRIAVFNTGDPIPDEDLPHIWESFYKVDKAHTRSYGGTGIGLSVVAAVMTAHGMPYGVENVENGVCFFLELTQK